MGWRVGKYSSQVPFPPKVSGPKLLEEGKVVGSLQCQAGAQDLSGRPAPQRLGGSTFLQSLRQLHSPRPHIPSGGFLPMR